MLPTLRSPILAKTKKKLKKPTLKFRNRDLSRPEVLAPFHLLDLAHLKPTSLLPLLHPPAALLPPRPLELCIKKLQALSDPRYAGCRCNIYV
jgi:hypothetical protein